MENNQSTEKKAVIKELTELGKNNGQISTKEILDAIGELDFDPEQLYQVSKHKNSAGPTPGGTLKSLFAKRATLICVSPFLYGGPARDSSRTGPLRIAAYCTNLSSNYINL